MLSKDRLNSSFSDSRQISSMDSPVFFYLMSLNITRVKKNPLWNNKKCWVFVCVFNSMNLNYYQAFFLQYKPLHLWWEINQLLHQFYTILFSTIQHSPLPLLTPRDQWPVWTEAPEFTFTLLAHSGCLVFHLVPSCNADAVCEEGLASSGKKNGVKSRSVCTPTFAHRRHGKTEVSLWHSLLWVRRHAHCFSGGLCCLSNETQRDDLLQSERPCLSKGVVRQCNWASLLHWQACLTPSFPSPLLPFRYFFFY